MREQQAIQDQVTLPLRVAVGVVMQGIRIRFGRSVVTILGVVFGIAFLMSVLTSQIIREGVGDEEVLRTEVKRMASFLSAETGLPGDATYGVVTCGPLSDVERRLLQHLVDQGAQRFRWAGAVGAPLSTVLPAQTVERVALEEVGRGAQAVLVVGHGALPEAEWATIMCDARQPVMAFSRSGALPPEIATVTAVSLERELKPEEVERQKLDARRQRFRNIWIVIVSLLVTVIGISNAMLMSVTERFREIGTMKCVGALSAFIRRIFLIESGFMGLIGGITGAVAGALFSVAMYSTAYGVGSVVHAIAPGRLLLYLVASILAGMLLSMLAAIYPASVAAGMVPSDALRTNI